MMEDVKVQAEDVKVQAEDVKVQMMDDKVQAEDDKVQMMDDKVQEDTGEVFGIKLNLTEIEEKLRMMMPLGVLVAPLEDLIRISKARRTRLRKKVLRRDSKLKGEEDE
jgi:hypothetical protein